MSILLADDHPPTRAGIRASLEETFHVCAEVGTADAAVEAATRLEPDVCLLDVHMPGSGIRAAERISSTVSGTTIVMLTVSDADDDLFDALRAGASGYLLKDTEPEELPDLLLSVLRGEGGLPRSLVPRLIEVFRERGQRKVVRRPGSTGVTLTTREWEVLEFLRDGLSTDEIAARLFVSAGTVRTHVSAILKKLQVPDREAALRVTDPGSGEDQWTRGDSNS